MAAALALLLVGLMPPGALGGQFKVSLPQKIDVLNGSCVMIPCSFDIEDKYESDLDNTCRAIWFKESFLGPVAFDSSGAQGTIQGNLNGVLTSKNCTTTLNNMTPQYNDDYFFRLQCDNSLRYNFVQPHEQISVREFMYLPTRLSTKTHSDSVHTEGGRGIFSELDVLCSSSLCVSEKNKIKTSVVSFTASHLHNGLEMSCTAVYRKQDGSTESSVKSSLTADVTYSPKDTTVSVSPSGPVKEDTDVTLTCSSNANPAVRNYTWYRSDRGQEFVFGTGRVFNIQASEVRDPVFCVAENEVGAGKSDTVHLDVQYSPKDTSVSVSPSGPVKEDADVTLTCSSNANPAVRNYTWYRADGGQEFVIGTGRVFNIQASKVSDPVFCVAENEVGAGKSDTVHLDVQRREHSCSPYSGVSVLTVAGVSLTLSIVNTICMMLLWKQRTKVKPKEEDKTYATLESSNRSPDYDVIAQRHK